MNNFPTSVAAGPSSAGRKSSPSSTLCASAFGVDVIKTGTDFLPARPIRCPPYATMGSGLTVTTDLSRLAFSLPSMPPVAAKSVPVWTVLSRPVKLRVTVSGCDQRLDQPNRGGDGGGVQTGVETVGFCFDRQCIEHIAARSR